MPKPGVKLLIADLVENLPDGIKLSVIFQINTQGDMLGFDDQFGIFMLEKLEDTEAAGPVPVLTESAFSSVQSNNRSVMHSQVAERVNQLNLPTKGDYYLQHFNQ